MPGRSQRHSPLPGIQTVLAGLPVGDPAAVEAQRDPGWQVNARDWFGREVLGGEDDQVGCAAVGVVDEGHEVAIILGGIGG